MDSTSAPQEEDASCEPVDSTSLAIAEEPVPSADRVVATIESEMKRLERRASRSGLTLWAGIIAASGMIWTFLTILENYIEVIVWGELFTVLTAFVLAADAIYAAIFAVLPRRSGLRSTRFGLWFANDVVKLSKPQVLFSWGRICFLWIGCYTFLFDFVGWINWILLVTYGFVILVLPPVIFINRNRGFVPNIQRKKWWEILIGLALAVAIGAAATLTLLGLAKAGVLGSIYLVKLGLLGGAFSYLTLMLVGPKFEVAALEELAATRRSLGFGEIDAQQAIAQAEVTITGYRANQVLAVELEQVRESAQGLDECVKKSRVLSRAFDGAYRQAQAKLDTETFTVIESHFRGMVQHHGDAEDEWLNATSKVDEFIKLINKLEHDSAGTEDFEYLLGLAEKHGRRLDNWIYTSRFNAIKRQMMMRGVVQKAEHAKLRVDDSTVEALLDVIEPPPKQLVELWQQRALARAKESTEQTAETDPEPEPNEQTART